MKRIVLVLLIVTVIPILVYELFIKTPAKVVDANPDRNLINRSITPQIKVAGLVANEIAIRNFDRRLSLLDESLNGLALPGEAKNKLFFSPFRQREILGLSETLDATGNTGSIAVQAKLARTVSEGAEEIWPRLLEKIHSFEFASFQSIKVNQRTANQIVVLTNFTALAKSKKQTYMDIKAFGKITWRHQPGSNWLIDEWDFYKFKITECPKRFFRDVTAERLSDKDLVHTQKSEHYVTISKLFNPVNGGFKNPTQRKFFPRGGAVGRHPSLAVVDINGDGWDDFYLVQQWRRNLLFQNDRKGNFVETAKSYGLDSPGYDSAALFADFDNDGDHDLFLGCSLEPSKYFRNDSGKFVNVTDKFFKFRAPSLVTSISAADYNNDGLLDVYLSTYGFRQVNTKLWANTFLTAVDREQVFRSIESDDYNRFFNAAGPSNLLLINRGNRFEISPVSDQVSLGKNSVQSVWADYDQDGDQDLYIVNDNNSDNLFRNERENGFVDVSNELGTTNFGFGKGASWGDFDQDGFEDLHVSNVGSIAGKRISEHFESLDSKFAQAASGDLLYQNQNGKLSIDPLNTRVLSGESWSFGGQFFDADNDGDLDLYVPSGFFTPPDSLTSHKDLSSEYWRSIIRSKGGLAKSFANIDAWKDKMVLPDQWYNTLSSSVVNGKTKMLIHAHGQKQRNRFYLNDEGDGFVENSSFSGADAISDGRCFAFSDLDQDSLADVILVSMNSPHLQIFKNELSGHVQNKSVAIRLMGGNTKPAPSSQWSNRNGVGALVTVEAGKQKIVRCMRFGEGFSAQNSSTMIIGIGQIDNVNSIQIRWPSGKITETTGVRASSLISVYENPNHSPNANSFYVQAYSTPKAE